jgi:hypothetical protein
MEVPPINKEAQRAVTALLRTLPLGAPVEAAKETMTEWAPALPVPRSDLSIQMPVPTKGAKSVLLGPAAKMLSRKPAKSGCPDGLTQVLTHQQRSFANVRFPPGFFGVIGIGVSVIGP